MDCMFQGLNTMNQGVKFFVFLGGNWKCSAKGRHLLTTQRLSRIGRFCFWKFCCRLITWPRSHPGNVACCYLVLVFLLLLFCSLLHALQPFSIVHAAGLACLMEDKLHENRKGFRGRQSPGPTFTSPPPGPTFTLLPPGPTFASAPSSPSFAPPSSLTPFVQPLPALVPTNNPNLPLLPTAGSAIYALIVTKSLQGVIVVPHDFFFLPRTRTLKTRTLIYSHHITLF